MAAENELMLLADWARQHGVQVQAAIRRAKNGALVTVEKKDGRWWIRSDEPNADKRNKEGRAEYESYLRKLGEEIDELEKRGRIWL